MPDEQRQGQPRGMFDVVARSLARHPVVVLTGPRAVGKTTLARGLVEAGDLEHYVSLADPRESSRALADASAYVDALPSSTVVDDVQLVPDLLGPIADIGASRGGMGIFLAVGALSKVRPGVPDVVPRRVPRLALGTLTQAEKHGRVSRFLTSAFSSSPRGWPVEAMSLDDYLLVALTGGFPIEAGADVTQRTTAAAGHLDDVLARTGSLSERERLRQVFRHLVTRPGNRVVVDRVATELGVDQLAIVNALDQLESLHALVRLTSWSRFRRSAPGDSIRAFAAESAYLGGLLGVRDVGNVDGANALLLLRTLVAHELLTQNRWARRHLDLTFWRSKPPQYEIDFLLEDDAGEVVPIVVSTRTTPGLADLAGIDAFRRRHPRAFRQGVLLYPGDAVKELGEDRWAVPLSALWAVDATTGSHPDVASLDVELTNAVPSLRALVERARPTERASTERQDRVAASMPVFVERLERIRHTLTEIGLVVEPVVVGSLVPGQDGRVPAWLADAAPSIVASEPRPPVAMIAAGLAMVLGVESAEVTVASTASRGADDRRWLALVVAVLRNDGGVAWRSCHAVASAGPQGVRVVGLAGPVLGRYDDDASVVACTADQLCASIAATLPDALAVLLPAA